MVDTNKVLSKSTLVNHDNSRHIIKTSKMVKKRQEFKAPIGNNTARLDGTQNNVNFNFVMEQNPYKILDHLMLRYRFRNTGSVASSGFFVRNGIYPAIDRLRIMINGTEIFDYCNGTAETALTHKFSNYENVGEYINAHYGTYGSELGKERLLLGETGQFYESSFSDIVNVFDHVPYMYFGRIEIDIKFKNVDGYLNNGYVYENVSTGAQYNDIAEAVQIENIELVMLYTESNDVVVNMPKSITFHDEIYRTKLFDVSALGSDPVEIILSRDFSTFKNIKKLFLSNEYTDLTILDETSIKSEGSYDNIDFGKIEVYEYGRCILELRDKIALNTHVQRYQERRRRRTQHYTDTTGLRWLPTFFIDFDKTEISLSNDHQTHKSLVAGESSRDDGSDLKILIYPATTWSVANRSRLKATIEISQISVLHADGNKNPVSTY